MKQRREKRSYPALSLNQHKMVAAHPKYDHIPQKYHHLQKPSVILRQLMAFSETVCLEVDITVAIYYRKSIGTRPECAYKYNLQIFKFNDACMNSKKTG